MRWTYNILIETSFFALSIPHAWNMRYGRAHTILVRNIVAQAHTRTLCPDSTWSGHCNVVAHYNAR